MNGWGALSIRRSVTTAMLYLCLSLYGMYALYTLPVSRLPDVQFPVIAVVTTYIGASPEDIETLVSSPIERAVASVDGVERVESTSRSGTSIVIISFAWGTDMDFAEVEVRKNIELFANDFLPDEATRPLTFAFDPSIAPVVFMAVEGPLDPYRLRELASEQIQPFLQRIDGVAAAEVVGGLDREIQVRLSPVWLQANGISPSQVVEALQAANAIVPSGGLDDGDQLLNIQPTSSFQNVSEIEQVVVGAVGNRPVLLSEVADVVDTFQEQSRVVTANGRPAVMVAVRKQSDANVVDVSRAVEAAMPRLLQTLPEGVRISTLFDEADSILRALNALGGSAQQAFWLTAMVLLLFLRSWRAALINVVAIPVSVFVALVAMSWLGVTLNLVSMAGLVLAIGMIVDNATVVLETTYQNLERKMSPSGAAIEAVREMTGPIIGATLTTVVVFIPILMVQGVAGELFRDMVLTICSSLLASLLVAVTLVPLMSAKLLGRDQNTWFTRFMTRATIWIDWLGPAYERGLGWSVRHPWMILGGATMLFFGSIALVPWLGVDFLPAQDVADIGIRITASPGVSLREMRRRVAEVENLIHEVAPETDVLTSDFGTAEGLSAIFGMSNNRANIRVGLKPRAQRTRSQAEVENDLARHFRELPGLEIKIEPNGMAGAGEADVEVKMFGDDLDALRRYGEVLRDELAMVDGVRETRFSMAQANPELSLEFDRERMHTLGLAPATVAAQVAAYYQGIPATVYREDGNEFIIRVRAPRESREDIDALRYLPIHLPIGDTTVPLSSVARVGYRLGATDIERENQRRRASVNVTGADVDLGTLTDRVEARIQQLEVPEGIRLETAGTAAELRDAILKLGLALLTALLLVYMVMASEFESLLEPFVIMATVPLAIIGVILALAITGTSLQVTAIVGVILLGGVVVGNGIVLIDVVKRRLEEGRELVDAIMEAGRTRLRPILMTATTTAVGMVPSAIGVEDGGELWAPLGRAVIGGMLFSTLLTLFVVPILYMLLVRMLERWRPRAAAPEPANDVAMPYERRDAAE